jgi:hypothetical protein
VVEAKDGTDRARLRPITLGAVRGNSVAVTAGLALGERVVATAGLQLADGDPVRPLSREGAK